MPKPYAYVTTAGRSVPADVLDAYATKAGSQQLPAQRSFDGYRSLAAPRYDPAALARILDVNTAHAAACKQKAVDVAGGGWRFDPVGPDADPAERDQLAAFFTQGQPERTMLDHPHLGLGLHAAQLDYEAMGRGVLELIRDQHAAGRPLVGLAHAPAHTVRVDREGRRFLQQRGGRYRWFRAATATDVEVDYETGRMYQLGELRPERCANDMLWWRHYHPHDPTYGLPDVIPAIGAVHGDAARRDYNIDFFENFGVPGYAVFVTGDFDPGATVNASGEPTSDDDPAARTELDYHIEQMFKEVRQNPHASMVFTLPTRPGVDDGKVEVKFEPLATQVKEASFRLYRKDNREEVLSSHRMSSALAGVFDAGAANREALTMYKRAVVAPRQHTLERIINTHVVQALGVQGWVFRLNAFETRDLQRELEMWVQLLEQGAVTLRHLIEHFAEPLGLQHPPDATDPVLDERRRPPQGGGPGGPGGEGAVMAELRDAMAELAAKAAPATGGNGHSPSADRARVRALLDHAGAHGAAT